MSARLCDTYAVTCIEGTDPPRGVLSRPSDAASRLAVGSFGVGTPIPGGGWRLGQRDFCRAAPHELAGDSRPSVRDKRPMQADCFCPTRSMWPRANDTLGFGRRAPLGSLPRLPSAPAAQATSAQCGGESYVVYACTAGLLLPPPPRWQSFSAAPRLFVPPPGASALKVSRTRTTVDVFIATSDHFGHGLFALVTRVLNQLYLARRLGLEPYVHIGRFAFTEPQACESGPSSYYDAQRGPNLWDYYFEQPGTWRPGDSVARSPPRVGGRGGDAAAAWLPVRSVQVGDVDLISSGGPVQTYGLPHTYAARKFSTSRAAAHAILGTHGARLVKQSFRDAAAAISGRWRERSGHVLGVHLRGTDKTVRRRVPPEAYFPLIDAYLGAHPDALIFLATDDARYHARMQRRYGPTGRISSTGSGFVTRAVVTDPRLAGGTKGDGALLDALLLARVDFLLKSDSAVAEFGLWLNPRLHRNHLDLQVMDRFKTQPLPRWAGSEVVPAFCAGLELGCEIEANETSRGSEKFCARCPPPV